LGFLIFFVPFSVFSYAATLCLFLPCLFVISRKFRLKVWLTGLVGALLGGLLYLPVSWQMYRASGSDSGPPSGTYWIYLRQNFLSESWLFFAAGLITALSYWYLAKPSARRDNQPVE